MKAETTITVTNMRNHDLGVKGRRKRVMSMWGTALLITVAVNSLEKDNGIST